LRGTYAGVVEPADVAERPYEIGPRRRPAGGGDRVGAVEQPRPPVAGGEQPPGPEPVVLVVQGVDQRLGLLQPFDRPAGTAGVDEGAGEPCQAVDVVDVVVTVDGQGPGGGIVEDLAGPVRVAAVGQRLRHLGQGHLLLEHVGDRPGAGDGAVRGAGPGQEDRDVPGRGVVEDAGRLGGPVHAEEAAGQHPATPLGDDGTGAVRVAAFGPGDGEVRQPGLAFAGVGDGAGRGLGAEQQVRCAVVVEGQGRGP